MVLCSQSIRAALGRGLAVKLRRAREELAAAAIGVLLELPSPSRSPRQKHDVVATRSSSGFRDRLAAHLLLPASSGAAPVADLLLIQSPARPMSFTISRALAFTPRPRLIAGGMAGARL